MSAAPIEAGEREVGYVLDELEQGRDPLDLLRFDDPGEHAHAVITHILAGATVDEASSIAANLKLRGITHLKGLDDLTAAIMVAEGVDPLVLSWLAALSADIAHAHRNGEPFATIDLASQHDHSDCMTRIDLAPDVIWYAYGTLVIGGLPDTLVNTMEPGDPLKPILSHPLLDAHPFRIGDVDAPDGPGRVLIEVDFENRWIEHRIVTVDALVAMHVGGRR